MASARVLQLDRLRVLSHRFQLRELPRAPQAARAARQQHRKVCFSSCFDDGLPLQSLQIADRLQGDGKK